MPFVATTSVVAGWGQNLSRGIKNDIKYQVFFWVSVLNLKVKHHDNPAPFKERVFSLECSGYLEILQFDFNKVAEFS